MTLNLNKHGQSMQSAWKEVLDETSSTDWALFGYENNHTFDLKLVSKGSGGGLEELCEDLNSNKILYAFVRVQDPKTELNKFVFVHWQGEAAPATRKGLCATHLREITSYFHGWHVSVNARSEDELDEAEVMKQVARASATVYNFKERSSAAVDPPPKLHSAHKRIVPEQELPRLQEREQFWAATQNEEKARREQERQKKLDELESIENERAKREEIDTKRREEAVAERESRIKHLKDAEAAQLANEREQQQREESKRLEELNTESASKDASKGGVKGRAEEASRLIARRTSESKAVFEHNSAFGQMNSRRESIKENPQANVQNDVSEIKVEESKKVDVAPKTDEVLKRETAESPVKTEAPVKSEVAIVDDIAVANADEVVPPPADFGGKAQSDLLADVASTTSSALANTSKEDEEQVLRELGMCAVALYDYEAADETEISFDPDQLITNIDPIDPGWWQGLGPQGHFGLFPANYVETVDAARVLKLQKELAKGRAK